jgi:hypothetical protein
MAVSGTSSLNRTILRIEHGRLESAKLPKRGDAEACSDHCR